MERVLPPLNVSRPKRKNSVIRLFIKRPTVVKVLNILGLRWAFSVVGRQHDQYFRLATLPRFALPHHAIWHVSMPCIRVHRVRTELSLRAAPSLIRVDHAAISHVSAPRGNRVCYNQRNNYIVSQRYFIYYFHIFIIYYFLRSYHYL